MSSLVAWLEPNMLKTSNSISCDCQFVAEGETWSCTKNSKKYFPSGNQQAHYIVIHQVNQEAYYIQVF